MKDAATAILELLGHRADGLTICPSEVARAIDPVRWRESMPLIHEAARTLVKAEQIVLTQKGAVKVPDEIAGAYRIRKA